VVDANPPENPSQATRQHWNKLHQLRPPSELSWYAEQPRDSMAMLDSLQMDDVGISVIDVGGGISRFVDALLRRGYSDVGVLDVSSAALALSRDRVGAERTVHWIEANVLTWLPPRQYDLWHDRAVFHFLTTSDDRASYRKVLSRALAPTGHAIIGAFAPQGPATCSGLPVARYSVEQLAAEFEGLLDVTTVHAGDHITPNGIAQPFSWIAGRRSPR